MPESCLHDRLTRGLKAVRKFGRHRLAQNIEAWRTLSDLATTIYGVGTADRIDKMLHESWNKRAGGAQVTAVGVTLGLETGRRGARPAVLREVAVTRLGYASVDTFREKP